MGVDTEGPESRSCFVNQSSSMLSSVLTLSNVQASSFSDGPEGSNLDNTRTGARKEGVGIAQMAVQGG